MLDERGGWRGTGGIWGWPTCPLTLTRTEEEARDQEPTRNKDPEGPLRYVRAGTNKLTVAARPNLSAPVAPLTLSPTLLCLPT